MSSSPFDAALLSVTVDTRGDTPIYRQLFEQFRGLILSERVAAGQRRPLVGLGNDRCGLSRLANHSCLEC